MNEKGMTGKATGGPAFPTLGWADAHPGGKNTHGGMTLRDWFAGQAAGALASVAVVYAKRRQEDGWPPEEVKHAEATTAQIAWDAYRLADCLLIMRDADTSFGDDFRKWLAERER